MENQIEHWLTESGLHLQNECADPKAPHIASKTDRFVRDDFWSTELSTSKQDSHTALRIYHLSQAKVRQFDVFGLRWAEQDVLGLEMVQVKTEPD